MEFTEEQKQRIEKKRRHVPDSILPLFDRVVSGGNSRADAIKLQCLECNGYLYSETRKCDSVSCPLYHFNPFNHPESPENEPISDAESTNETESYPRGETL